jgi:CHAT domain-containing protein/Tfp pilus assembly protein PilF
LIVTVSGLLSISAQGLRSFDNAALSQQQAQPRAPESNALQTLEAGKPVERQLAGGQKHSYQIALAAGQYASLLVEQRGIDVIVRALGADGKFIGEWDSEIRLKGRETAGLVSESAGSFRLEIEAKYKTAAAGEYEVLLGDLRAATIQDRLLQEARTLHGEANRLIGAGKYDQARPVLEKSLQIRQQGAGADHPDTARTMMLMANLCYYTDDFGAAERLYNSAIIVLERGLGPLRPVLAICLNNLASLYQATGNLTKSEVLHQRALEIRQTELPADHPDIAQSLNNLANVYRTKGDYATAEPLYSRALDMNEKILGPDHINLASPLNNLGQLHKEMGNFDKAERLFQRSLKIREEKLAPDHPEVAVVLIRLGLLYYEKRDYTAADALFQRAQGIWEKRYGPSHSELAAVLNNRGSVYLAQNDSAKAEPFYQRALAMKEATLGAQHPEIVTTLHNLARLSIANGEFHRAVDFQSRAVAVTERNIGFNLATGSERQKLAYLASLPAQFSQTISLHVHYAPEDSLARDLAVTTVLRRKGRVLDAMSDSLAALRRRFSAADQSLLSQLNEATTQLAKVVLNGPQGTAPAEHQKKIKALEEQREKLEAEVGRRSDGFYRESRPVTLAAVQSAIPDNAALIEFAVYRPFDPKAHGDQKVYGESHYVAYVVRNSREVQWKELGAVKEIDGAIDDLRKTLRDPKRRDRQLARALDERIMRPLRPFLGDAVHLLISPDGALNLIPFEALVDEQNRYLVERYTCTYLTSGRDLLRLPVARVSKSQPLLIADPQFGEPEITQVTRASAPEAKPASHGRKSRGFTTGEDLSSVYFAPLNGTAQEARAIKSLFAEANVLTGTQATESSVKQTAAPRILHIATHGFFLTDTPTPSSNATLDGTRAISANVKIGNPLLRSGLALAGANLTGGSGDDGILTALEASGLNLWGTKLVTLSACDTGVGEVKSGEGVYGLRRAFVLAGAETLVMSLWPVSDYMTREIMTAYYRGLKQGQGRDQALRQMQLSMLRRKDRQHPFYWASFIQWGEWASLDGKR